MGPAWLACRPMTRPESPSSQLPTVAVLGAGGIMGLAIARNLARAGYGVQAWNRTKARALALEGDGATVHDTAAGAVAGADVIVTMLTDGDATRAVMAGESGALAQAAPGTVWLQMATIGAPATAQCIALAQQRGVGFVDAPVAGTKQPAIDGTLTILASGDDALRAVADPVFDVLGARTVWAGAAGRGTDLKLVINSWLVAVVEGVAESFALAEGIGIDPRLMLDALAGGPLDPGFLRVKGAMILDREFPTNFSLSNGAKDARLAAEVAAARGLDLPVLRAIADRMTAGAERYGDEDIAATWRLSAPPQP